MSNSIKILGTNQSFSVVPNHILENPDLSWKAKGLATYLCGRPDNWTIKFRDLVRRSTEGKAAVRSGIQELREAGYIQSVKIYDHAKKRLAGEQLQFAADRRWAKEPADQGDRFSGVQKTRSPENQESRKPGHLINNSPTSNTSKNNNGRMSAKADAPLTNTVIEVWKAHVRDHAGSLPRVSGKEMAAAKKLAQRLDEANRLNNFAPEVPFGNWLYTDKASKIVIEPPDFAPNAPELQKRMYALFFSFSRVLGGIWAGRTDKFYRKLNINLLESHLDTILGQLTEAKKSGSTLTDEEILEEARKFSEDL
jgi:hypothetical protein